MQTILYSHSDYCDILNIQLDHITKFLNIDLITNLKIDNQKIKNTYLYNDTRPYGDRIFNSILESNLNEKYTLLLHDIDIIFNINKNYLDQIIDTMNTNNIDRVDLKHQNFFSPIEINLGNKSLYKTSFPADQYIYNVNPSIWKTSALLKVFALFREQSYRNIELSHIQDYCSNNFNFYITNSQNPIRMGYYDSYDDFTFFHISHYGQFFPLKLQSKSIESDYFSYYKNIVEKYGLLNGKRSFRESLH